MAFTPASAAALKVAQSGSPTDKAITSCPFEESSLAFATSCKVGDGFIDKPLLDNIK
jgi:hypothetical protein